MLLSAGGITKVSITIQLLLPAVGAPQKYQTHLGEQKKVTEKKIVDLKRMALNDELHDLKKKRATIEAAICALEMSVDEYAEKAETTSRLTFIAKSNSFHCTTQESISAEN